MDDEIGNICEECKFFGVQQHRHDEDTGEEYYLGVCTRHGLSIDALGRRVTSNWHACQDFESREEPLYRVKERERVHIHEAFAEIDSKKSEFIDRFGVDFDAEFAIAEGRLDEVLAHKAEIQKLQGIYEMLLTTHFEKWGEKIEIRSVGGGSRAVVEQSLVDEAEEEPQGLSEDLERRSRYTWGDSEVREENDGQSWTGFRVVQPPGRDYLDREGIFVQLGNRVENVMHFPGQLPDEVMVLTSDLPPFRQALHEAGVVNRLVEMSEEEIATRKAAMRPAAESSDRPNVNVPGQPARRTPHPQQESQFARTSRQLNDLEVSGDIFAMEEGQFRDQNRVAPRRGRGYRWVVDKVGHMLSREQIREVAGIVGTGIATGGLTRRPHTPIKDDGEFALDEITGKGTPTVVSRLDRASKKSKSFKDVEGDIRKQVAKMKYSEGTSDQLVTYLLGNTDGYVQAVKGKISVLSEEYVEKQAILQRSIGVYQAGKMIRDRFESLKGEFQNEDGARKRKAVFNAYAKLFGGSAEHYAEQHKKAIDEFMESVGLGSEVDEVEKLIQSLVQTDDELVAQRRLFEAAVYDRRAVMLERVNAQLETINSFSFVEKIEMDSDKFRICLAEVDIEHDGKLWKLGKYKVELAMSRSPKEGSWIWIMGDTFRGKSDQHPHIIGRGNNICWGNIKEGIHKLYAEWDFPMLINLIWNFLHAYNSGDCYTSLSSLFSTIPNLKSRPLQASRQRRP